MSRPCRLLVDYTRLNEIEAIWANHRTRLIQAYSPVRLVSQRKRDWSKLHWAPATLLNEWSRVCDLMFCISPTMCLHPWQLAELTSPWPQWRAICPDAIIFYTRQTLRPNIEPLVNVWCFPGLGINWHFLRQTRAVQPKSMYSWSSVTDD